MSKEAYISYIVEQMQGGMIDAEKICAVFCSKFQKSSRTFYNHWNIAQERFKQAQILIEKEKSELYKAKEIEAKKASILSREQVLEMASNVVKLAYNKVAETKGKDKEVYAFASALEKYNKLNGFDAPNKNETLIKGVDVIEIIRNEDKS